MRTLVLGGTVFLGRHVAAEALARGHELTLFTRGLHGAELFPEAEHLRGDRSEDLSALRGREWDAVVDTSGYKPADVAASSELLADAAEHLVFVSSINAYPGWPAEAVAEDSPVWESDADDYGPAKAACERAAEAAMPGRVASVRAGLIVGPNDGVFRLPWWVRRIAHGGDVPAPGDPEREHAADRRARPRRLDARPRRAAGRPARSTPPARSGRRRWARCWARRSTPPPRAPGSSGCPTRRCERSAPSRGPSCRCGRRRTRCPARGASAPSARRPPASAAGP